MEVSGVTISLMYNGTIALNIPVQIPWISLMAKKIKALGTNMRTVVAMKVTRFVTKNPFLSKLELTFSRII